MFPCIVEFSDLLQFVEVEDVRLRERYASLDREKHILARTVKLTEELGELCNEILAKNLLQRKQKLDGHDSEKLSEEFAEVIITAFLVAKSLDVDVKKALEDKIAKINSRYQ